MQDDDETETGNETGFNDKVKAKGRQLFRVDEERTFEHFGQIDPLISDQFKTPVSIKTSAGNRWVRAAKQGKGTLGGAVSSHNCIPPLATVYTASTHKQLQGNRLCCQTTELPGTLHI